MKKILGIFLSPVLLLSATPVLAIADATTTYEESLDAVIQVICFTVDPSQDWDAIEATFDDTTSVADVLNAVPLLDASYADGIFIEEDVILTNGIVYESIYGEAHDSCIGHPVNDVSDERIFVMTPAYYRTEGVIEYLIGVSSSFDDLTFLTPTFSDSRNTDSLIVGETVYLIVEDYNETDLREVYTLPVQIKSFYGTSLIELDLDWHDAPDNVLFAVDSYGNIIGTDSEYVYNDDNNVYIQSILAMVDDISALIGDNLIVRDFGSIHQKDNSFINIYEDLDINISLSTDILLDAIGSDITLLGGQYDPELHNQDLIDRLRGRTLLQVQEHGEAWWILPSTGERHYLRNGNVAYDFMREMSLGITDADLETIPSVDTFAEFEDVSSVCESNALAARLSGEMLLQVEQHGEAWYMDPVTCHRIYLEDGDAAYSLMREMGLGILDVDLVGIPMGPVIE